MKRHLLSFLCLLVIGYGAAAQTAKETEKKNASADSVISLQPVLNLDDDDLSATDDEDLGDQNISSLLSTSRDVFLSKAGYVLGRYRFRYRGLGSENNQVFMNGISMSDPESGRIRWSNWGGLNDVTRNKITQTGFGTTDFGLGTFAGATSIDTRASEQRKGTRISYSTLNGSYKHRIMATHSTGLMENGWAFTVSGSRRWAKEGFLEGTFYDAWAYFLSVDKIFNNNHSINLTTYGSPTERGGFNASAQYIYDFAGSHYYNPNWGYQNGEKRNSRVSNAFKPTVMLTDYLKLGENTTLTSTISFMKSWYGKTAFNWQNAGDPRPNYYKKFGNSYLNPENHNSYNKYVNDFIRSEEARQVQWDLLYQANMGQNAYDPASKKQKAFFILEDRRNDSYQADFSSVLKSELSDQLSLRGGVAYTHYHSRQYKEVADLLGADYWLDIDTFAERDQLNADSDLRNPNRKVKEGDTFGNDYNIDIRKGRVFGIAEFTLPKFDFYTGGELRYTRFWRTGNMENGKFPNQINGAPAPTDFTSYGESKKLYFIDGGIKAGATYKINGRNYLSVNGMIETQAPTTRNSFISPRTRNAVVGNLKNQINYGGEASYSYRSPGLRATLTGYAFHQLDKTKIMGYFNDDLRTFNNLVLTEMDEEYVGLEFGFDAKLTSALSLNGVASISQNLFLNNPNVQEFQDNRGNPINTENIFVKYFKLPGGPQTAYSLGAMYRSPKYWSFNIDANYLGQNYISMNPVRRPKREPDDLRLPEEVDGAFTLDLSFRKSWKFNNVMLYLSANANNILDNQFVTGGYEQLRKQADRFPSAYYYNYGRSYYVTLSLSF
ncbi:MAG: TonB-dependent receptor plug domain-containing protein [Cytophagales bacterium]|nr:TonB-dependent receptor plug domain-containing protein [Cytophagales bacterium]